jgi:cytochrome c oxidase assembly protein subunit 15
LRWYVPIYTVRAEASQANDCMTRAAADPERSSRATRIWLLAVAGLVFIMVLVGGATRLTESGLSIVEWKPVSGVLPPLSEADWQAEFAKYRTIHQYQVLNRGMDLKQFKTIFWWEWAHRLLGRIIGGAFLLPFLWFLWRGQIEPRLRAPLGTIFALGAVQGFGGWWMVASGLAERTSVSQYRLAFHLTLACLIYGALLWAAQRTRPRPVLAVSVRIRFGAFALLALVLVQIYLGALVAGLHAGFIYNTWPLIDGGLLPDISALFRLTPAWRNLFENALTAQFCHRIVAYALWLGTLVHLIGAARDARGFAWQGALALAAAMTVQASLGILTLLHQAPLALALLHQGMAMVVLTIAALHAERLVPQRQPVGVAQLSPAN